MRSEWCQEPQEEKPRQTAPCPGGLEAEREAGQRTEQPRNSRALALHRREGLWHRQRGKSCLRPKLDSAAFGGKREK